MPFLLASLAAQAQPPPADPLDELADRPVSSIRLQNLSRVSEQLVRNNLRTTVGEPLAPQTVRQDVQRLTRLGTFRYIDALAELQADGSVAVIFQFVEQAIINEVQVVGNKLISDQELLAVVRQVPRGPRDDFLIQNASKAIEQMYRKRGHYLTTVSVDETELEKEGGGVLIFRIIEGPRVKVRAVEFQGRHAFEQELLLRQIKTRTALFLLRKGELDEEVLNDDVAALDRFYRDRGYLDVRVDRQIELSPDSTEAKVVFLIAEGPRYTLRAVRATAIDGQPLQVFAPEQIAAMLELKPGDAYQRDGLRKSVRAVQDAYGLMGYMLPEDSRRYYQVEGWDVFVRPYTARVSDAPQVDLVLEIDEGKRYSVGLVEVSGDFLTQDKVIRRELPSGLTPGRPYDTRQITIAEERLMRTRLFNEARLTVQPEDPADPEYRDLLVEVKERNTGSVNFGVAIGSDSGVFGEISLTQNNFDISDYPESIGELLSGRAFRGAGQRFNATLRPGTEFFQLAGSWTEPYLFDTNHALTLSGQYRQRFFEQYDEERLGGSFRLSRQLGDVWGVGLQGRVERVTLTDIDPIAPTEVFADAGPDTVTSLGLSLSRTTITRYLRPDRGSRLELAYDRFGALGGDFAFNRITADYTAYFTVDEDFLGRLTTLRLDGRLGYIFGDRAPTYERFYLGGRSFRGFDFRTVSPKGIRNSDGLPGDDPVGGTWMLFGSAQYEKPIFEEAFTGVLWIDTGTVTSKPGLDDWRVSAGFGIRLYIPQFGDVPIAFDFGFPLIKQDGDRSQVLTFSAELPF